MADLLDGIINQQRQQSQSALDMTMATAVGYNPDEEAVFQKISKQTGLPVETIRMDKGKAAKEIQTIQDVQMVPSHAPATAKLLASHPVATVSHDSINNLSAVERIMQGFNKAGGFVSEQFTAGQKGVWSGRLGYQQMAGDTSSETDKQAIGYEIDAQIAGKKRDEAGVVAGKVIGGGLNFAGQMYEWLKDAQWRAAQGAAAGAAGGALLSAPTGGIAAPITAGTGAVLGASAGFGAGFFEQAMISEAGSHYRDLKKIVGQNGERIDDTVAKVMANSYGVLSGLVEQASLGIATAPLKKFAERELLKRGIDLGMKQALKKSMTVPTTKAAVWQGVKAWQGAALAEGVEEGVQEALAITSTYLAKELTDGQFTHDELENAGARIGQSFVDAYLAMQIPGMVGGGINLKNDLQEVKKAENNKAIFDALSKEISESPVYKRMPEVIQQQVAGIKEEYGGPVQNVYISPEKFVGFFQSQGIDPEMAANEIFGDPAPLQMALSQGHELAIPIEIYADKIAGVPKTHAALSGDIRVDGQQFTPNEAKEIRKNLGNQIAELKKQIEETSFKQDSTTQQVFDDIYQKLVDAGRPEYEARYNALIISQKYQTQASRISTTDNKRTAWDEYSNVMGQAQVLGGQASPQPGVMQQGGTSGAVATDTPEFKQWFGKSKVVDKKGNPLVVYHGTDSAFTEFANGDYFFFAEDKKHASGYGKNLVQAYLKADNLFDYADKASIEKMRPWVEQNIDAFNETDEDVTGWTDEDFDDAGIDPLWAGNTVDSIMQSLNDGIAFQFIEGVEGFVDELKRLGFDGFTTNEDGRNYAVFSPTQIKSVNNRGTFDPNDANILRQNTVTFIGPDGMSTTEQIAPMLPAGALGQINEESQAEWKKATVKWMKNNGYAQDQIDAHIAGMEGQIAILSYLGPLQIEMFPTGAKQAKKAKGPLRTNSDPIYKISFDASSMCVKRLEAAATAALIQSQLKRGLTTSERVALVAAFRAAGKEAPCLYCYVEAPRAKMVEFADKAIKVATGGQISKKWSATMRNLATEAQKEASAIGLNKEDIDINLFVDPVYLESHAAEFDAFKAKAPVVAQFIESYSLGAKANLPKLYEEYSGQILGIKKELIDELNGYAGLRFFSTSDFQAGHVVDLMQAFMDMALIGAKSHAYTKVENYVRIFGKTGQKIQMSIFAIIDKDGNISADTYQGWDWDKAKKHRAEKGNDHVGTVLVATDDRIIAWALEQDWIDYIIPFHHSGMEKKHTQALNWQDFTGTQSEKPLRKGVKGKKIRMHEIGVHEGMSDADATKAYLELAMERKLVPVFPTFLFNDTGEVLGKSGKPLSNQRKAKHDRAVQWWKEMVESGEIDMTRINPNYFKLKKDYSRTDTPFNAVDAQFDTAVVDEVIAEYLKTEGKPTAPDEQIAAEMVQRFNNADGADVAIQDIMAGRLGQPLNMTANQAVIPYTRLTKDEIPAKTQTAYKLMKLNSRGIGYLLPLYAKPETGAVQGFTLGEWYRAENQRPSIGGKQLAERSGIHAVDLPIFSQGKANAKGERRVWVEVEMPAMKESTQAESDATPILNNGQRQGISKRLIGPDEAYNYRTNPNATGAGAWPIAGSMKAVRILSDDEVEGILKASGADSHIANSMTGVDAERAETLNKQYIAAINSRRVFDPNNPNILMQSFAVMSNVLNDQTRYKQVLSWWEGYYGDPTKAKDELDDYDGQVNRLIEKGGKVYRVIFANDISEVNTDTFGLSWTASSSYIDDYIDRFWTQYAGSKTKAFIVEATVPAGVVSNNSVDIEGNPDEKEVNLSAGPSEYNVYEYNGKMWDMNSPIKTVVFNRGTFDPNKPNILMQSAWHGSPHTFDKFSTSAIGTGEGAQAYGYGLYFAGSKEVAEYYKKVLSERAEYDFDWSKVELPPALTKAEFEEMASLGNKMRKNGNLPEFEMARWRELKSKDNEYTTAVDKARPKGRLYKVELAPAEDEYLLWDKPLSEQSDKVREALANLDQTKLKAYSRTAKKLQAYFEGNPNRYGDVALGHDLYSALSDYGTGDQKAASEYLHSLGIRGIKYEDGNTRGKSGWQMVATKNGKVISDKNFATRELAEQAGKDLQGGVSGVTYDVKETASYNYVIFSDDDVAISEMYQRQQAGDSYRGYIDLPKGASNVYTVGFLEKANISTGMHEFAHLWLEELAVNAVRPDATQQMKDDFALAMKWLGIDETAESWATMPPDEKTKKYGRPHEKWADGFLNYLESGKAPSLELQSAFQRFTAWLKGLFQKLQIARVPLSDDIKGVFDRMLATDEQIMQAEQQSGLTKMLATAEDANMSEAQFSAYETTVYAANEKAREELMAKRMKELKKLRGEIHKQTRQLVSEEASQMPVYVAMKELRSEGGIRLSSASVKGILGTIPKRIAFMVSAEGLDPDAAAELFGYSSGHALLTDLSNAPSFNKYVKDETEARMQTEFGMDENEMAEAAMLAVHNDMQGQVLVEELKAIKRKMREVKPFTDQATKDAKDDAKQDKKEREYNARWTAAEKNAADEQARIQREADRQAGMATIPPIEVFKETAKRVIGNVLLRNVMPHTYLRAEMKAAKEAAAAFAKKNYLAAYDAKYRQMMNHYLYREAVKAREDGDKIYEFFQNVSQRKNLGKLGKASESFLEQVDFILDRFEFANVPNKVLDARTEQRETLDKFIARVAEETGIEIEVSDIVADEALRENYRELSMDDLRGVYDSVKFITQVASFINKLNTEKDQIEFEEGIALLVGRAKESLEEGKPLPVTEQSRRGLSRLQDNVKEYADMILRPERIIEWLDGGETGPWHELLWNKSVDADTKRNNLRVKILPKLQGILDGMTQDQIARMRESRRIDTLGVDMTIYEMIGVALNLGNTSNREKMMRGGIWVGEQWKEITQNSVDEITSHLTAEEARMIQGLWDAVNVLWPDVVALEKRRSGLEPVKIEANPVTIAGVELEGGYWPVVYDPRHSAQGEKQADAGKPVDQMMGASFTKAATKKSHVKERTDVARPMQFDWKAVVSRHVDNVITDLSHFDFVFQVRRILADTSVRKVIQNRLSETAFRSLEGWLKFTVNADYYGDPAAGIVYRIRRQIVSNTAIAALGFKVVTAFGNLVVGPVQAMDRVSPKYVAMGIGEFLRNPKAAMETSAELSGQMRHRVYQLDRTYQETINSLVGNDTLRAQIARAAMSIHMWVDRLGSTAIWFGAYREAQDMDPMADPMQWVRHADKAISMTQVAGAPKDLSAFERDPRYMESKMFLGPMLIMGNGIRSVFQSKGGYELWSPEAFGRLFALWFGPAIIFELAVGRGPDDDESWEEWFLWKILLYPFQTVPLIREAATAIEGAVTGKFRQVRNIPILEAISTVVKATKKTADAVFEDGEWSKAIKEDINAVGITYGLPSQQINITGQYFVDLLMGDYEPEHIWSPLTDIVVKRKQK